MNDFKPRTATVTIYQGDDEAHLAELEQAARRAKEGQQGPLLATETADWADLAQQYDALAEQAAERAWKVTLTALPRLEWKRMVANHPPREDNRSDAAVGVNEDTLPDELVPASVATIDPDPGDRGRFLSALNDVQFEHLYLTAFALNRGFGAGPKAGLSAELGRSSTET